ncbi:DUF1684 domain-containing protein [Dyadobacter chenwenxiniae]|uniref:DUF1684 domain-containing protein n=1 Tax=Dyadobacter chenwenxiniae TaxID=2906456 RepID=A0A9X1TFR8_9BACT|nr:DUF1684 domain-containing protein [Dyadobacter chenwenxiniae]MCF0049162.1 DUF1684 domain-containing protein [Dyadobacter chenwenxiniae]MCF0064631.1 DUF1684 domain-containing protein [Dyadobacter chenwenxiniae]UON84313.1 DUF1684 domain-containing protein [Dyadobacter chenwenxiniae]
MKKYSYHLVWLAGIYLLSAFTANDTAYEQEIQQWHQKRVESLKAESGWLNLAGLFWLEEGKNTFGGDGKNNVNFPADKSNPFLGEIILEKGKVTLKANADAEVFNGDAPVTELDIFPGEKPVTLRHKSLRWFIIKRGDKYAVRLRDLESEYLKGFSGIERYPVQENWRVKARFEPTTGKKVSITDITGRTADQDSPGTLVFNVGGKEYRLDAVGSTENLFIIFADQTNKTETYGAGRFLYTSVEKDGSAWLDFNKSINPPCAFSPYATCPLPPKQNKLALAVSAGEKRYGEH